MASRAHLIQLLLLPVVALMHGTIIAVRSEVAARTVIHTVAATHWLVSTPARCYDQDGSWMV